MTEDGSSELEVLIHERVAGRTALAPVRLSTLLDEIDYRRRDVAGLDDFNAALGRLAARGLIREIPGQGYVDGRSGSGVDVHADISRSAYRRSLEQEWGAPPSTTESTADSIDVPNDPKLFVAVPTSGDRPSTAEWQRVEALAVRICEVLGERGRPFLVRTLRTSVDRIEFWVLGNASDDPELLLDVVAPIFGTMAPIGSSITVASET
jgi:hypothetical protein